MRWHIILAIAGAPSFSRATGGLNALDVHSNFIGTFWVVKELLHKGLANVECWQAFLDKKSPVPSSSKMLKHYRQASKSWTSPFWSVWLQSLDRWDCDHKHHNASGRWLVISGSLERSFDNSKCDLSSDQPGVYSSCHRAFFWHQPPVVLYT